MSTPPITEWKLSKAVQAGEVFEFSFPLDPSEVSLAFKPSFSYDADSPFTLMEDGVLVNRYFVSFNSFFCCFYMVSAVTPQSNLLYKYLVFLNNVFITFYVW